MLESFTVSQKGFVGVVVLKLILEEAQSNLNLMI